MRRLIMLVGLWALLLNPTSSWASPAGNIDYSTTPKTTVVVFLEPFYQQNEKALNIIKDGLRKKFGKADIIYMGGSEAKSPALLEFMEKVQTDPLNDKGIVLVREEYLRKYGQDTNSQFVVMININLTGYNMYNHWSRMILSAYNIDAAKPAAEDSWYKGITQWASQSAEYYMKRLQTEFTWPIVEPFSEVAQDAVEKPAVLVFLPEEIMEMPELIPKVRSAVAGRFRVNTVPIYMDNTPKSTAFLTLVNKVGIDSAKQKTLIVRKEYLSEYGKQVLSSPVIAIIIKTAENDFSIWSGRPVCRLHADILVVDTETNQYISSTTYDTGERMGRSEGIDFLLEKLQKEYKWR